MWAWMWCGVPEVLGLWLGCVGESVKVEGGDVDLSRWSFEEAEGAKGVVEYGSACREAGEGDSVLEVWGVRELES